MDVRRENRQWEARPGWIGAALDGTDFGIVCLTLENQHSPWLMFEAGALARHLKTARVVPLCIDIDPEDITGPLADWQARRLDQDGTRRLVCDLNAITTKPLPEQALIQLFEITWPRLEAAVDEAQIKAFREKQAQNPGREVSAQVLERIEQLERDSRNRQLIAKVSPMLSPEFISSLPRWGRRLAQFQAARQSEPESIEPSHSSPSGEM